MKSPTRFTLATPPAPGAIGLIQLHGPRAEEIARRLTAAEPTSRSRLVSFDGIDEGLIARLSGGWIQLMPHGGVRVIQRLAERLEQLGAEPEEERGTDARTLYPEAVSEIEADMLAAIARAASPAAVDPLLDQPRRWAEAGSAGDLDFSAIRRASDRLDRWVDPPSVVLVGRANVGKSTLSNLVVGRASSITADLPGTTRDHVSAAAELPTPIGPLAVRWFDTPGLRVSGDTIERRARSLTRRALSAADVLIAVRDPVSDWPDAADLPREPDLWLINKADLPDARASRSGDPDAAGHPPALFVSALRGEGLDPLAAAVARQLGLTRLDGPTPWAFSPALRQIVAREDMDRLRRYTAGNILPMR